MYWKYIYKKTSIAVRKQFYDVLFLTGTKNHGKTPTNDPPDEVTHLHPGDNFRKASATRKH